MILALTFLHIIVRKNGHKLIAINCMPDYIHVFVGMKPNQSLSDLMQDIKGDSSKWINQKKLRTRRHTGKRLPYPD